MRSGKYSQMPYPVKLYRPEIFENTSAGAWFTLKNAGAYKSGAAIPGLNLGFSSLAQASELKQNLEILAEAIETEPADIAWLKQVHGREIAVVASGGFAGEYDGLITRAPGLALAIQVADCAAVLLFEKQQKIIAAVHAGWRGAAAGIVPEVLTKIAAEGGKPENILAFISPCISAEKFEIGHEVAEQFPDEFVDYISFAKPHLDLKGFLMHQLTGQGVLKANIERSLGCTVSDAESYYSYRREKEASGRMMAVIKLTE